MRLKTKLNIKEFDKLMEEYSDDGNVINSLIAINNSTGVDHLDDGYYIRYLTVEEIFLIKRLITDSYPNIRESIEDICSQIGDFYIRVNRDLEGWDIIAKDDNESEEAKDGRVVATFYDVSEASDYMMTMNQMKK